MVRMSTKPEDAQMATVLTHPAPARQDAPFARHRSRLAQILNVPHLENKLSWQLGYFLFDIAGHNFVGSLEMAP